MRPRSKRRSLSRTLKRRLRRRLELVMTLTAPPVAGIVVYVALKLLMF